ncbi:hypothetical protein [Skermania piniformis]|uniref:Uncharacterized protein n=1 Tax=Skermania pinensis TaxID=39122 RepID=A0ABX8S9F1_9ACTN|nr:hypothetical protein [Skermania piniformis]QXQ14398.1 hypothetical protein KV203_02980 [Skermania piniformis]
MTKRLLLAAVAAAAVVAPAVGLPAVAAADTTAYTAVVTTTPDLTQTLKGLAGFMQALVPSTTTTPSTGSAG